jgi:hypothetical protein
MELSVEEIAKLVENLLNEAAQERKKKLIEERMKSSDFIKDVHEAYIGIDSDSFKIISKQQDEIGDLIIEWEAIEYIETEFTVDEPYKFEKSGKLLIRKNGEAELLKS